MILHIEFTDGANPYLMYASKSDCIMNWRWYKKHDSTARPLFMAGGLQCRRVYSGCWAVAEHFDGAHKTRYYSRLGNALNALERGCND